MCTLLLAPATLLGWSAALLYRLCCGCRWYQLRWYNRCRCLLRCRVGWLRTLLITPAALLAWPAALVQWLRGGCRRYQLWWRNRCRC